jgi:hypothetical protein
MDLFKSGTRRMLRDIESELRYARGLIGKDALDAWVMAAMARVPRERFVPGSMRPLAFRNGPLPIGHGQTISQPFIVALMSDLVLPSEASRRCTPWSPASRTSGWTSASGWATPWCSAPPGSARPGSPRS